jgi:transketolase
MATDLDQRSVNTLRFLSVDMVEKARSGHPGLPLGAAPMAYVLWQRHLRHNPLDPKWPDRDRFVLSAGHGSALLYALLHLSGYDLPRSELERFRQWGSRTPGHPESELTSGVEATTGPLGQGFAMGVGFAAAERFLAETFNREELRLVDHWTYALVSDGDLMEGVASEAMSFAGSAGLGKLLYLYDSNRISIEGGTELTFTEDVLGRFRAARWYVDRVEDGNDLDAIDAAIRRAREVTDRPHLIEVRTHIGFGSPKQDTKEAHGAPLGASAAEATRAALGWPAAPPFFVPPEVDEHFRDSVRRGRELEGAWEAQRRLHRERYPELAQDFDRAITGELPPGWEGRLPRFEGSGPELATREASGQVLNALAAAIPTLLGGSADLAPSTNTLLAKQEDFGPTRAGRNLHFGVREHAMAAIVNGMALHGGTIPYGATFLVFADYCRPALRLAALMRAPSRFIFTHDSIGLGEDGPTHQPIEHLWSLRAIPGMTVVRPADANETAAAWRLALGRPGPVAFALSRQKLPVLDPGKYPVATGTAHGAYVLSDAPAGSGPRLVLIATGSEVHLALAAQRTLAAEGLPVRVVSAPCLEVFAEEGAAYRDSVLPPGVPRLAVEAGSSLGWWKIVGSTGDVVGIDRFGASAPGPVLYEKLGFTAEAIAAKARALLG